MPIKKSFLVEALFGLMCGTYLFKYIFLLEYSS